MNLIIDGSALVADHFSGIGHYLQGIVEQLDKELSEDGNDDLSVYIAVPYRRANRLRKYHLKNIKVKKIPLPMRVLRGLVVRDTLPPMDTYLGKGVYFFPDYNTWPLAYSKAITTIHDLSFIDVPQFVDDNNAKFLTETLEKSLQRAAKIATVTHTMKRIIVERFHLKDSDVIVTENAVDMTDLYHRSDAEIRKVKKKYRIAGNYILSLGNIEPRKNQLTLIEALRKSDKSIRDNYTLLFVGAGGWKMEKIEEEVQKATDEGLRVQVLLGKVTDKDRPAIYSGASIVAQPSHYEGFGMPIVEAMACRVPLITSNTSVMPEVAGDAGILVDPSDPAMIAKAFKEVVDWSPAKRKEMLEKGVKRARAYQWTNAVRALLTAAREVNK